MNALQSEIVDYVIQRLIEHSFEPGHRLPPENDLANRFGTTRINVRRAYERLVDMGYIEYRADKGFYIGTRRQAIELVLAGDRSFSSTMASSGLKCETRVIEANTAPYQEHLWSKMGLGKHQGVYQLKRVRIIDGEPIAIHNSYLPMGEFPQITNEGPFIQSINQYFTQKGYLHLGTTGTHISLAFPTLEEQKLLKSHGLAPLLLVQTDCIDQESGRLLEMAKIIYKSDRIKYKF